MGSWRFPPAWKAGGPARGRGVRVASPPLVEGEGAAARHPSRKRGIRKKGLGSDSSTFLCIAAAAHLRVRNCWWGGKSVVLWRRSTVGA